MTLEVDLCESSLEIRSLIELTNLRYIWGLHSRSELQVTQEMLTLILTFHQVMPSYLDFISVFGAQSDSRDLRFSGFRESRNLIRSSRMPVLDSLGRSGRQFQLVYNFKGVTCKEKNEWSIRQAAIHHQFDIENGTTLWIVTKGHTDLQQRYKELTGPEGREEDRSFGDVAQCLRSSLAVHSLFCQWATEDWRDYLRWLEETIESEVSSFQNASSTPLNSDSNGRHQGPSLAGVTKAMLTNTNRNIYRTSRGGRTEQMRSQ